MSGIREKATAAKVRAKRLRELERDNAAAGRLGNEAQYDLTKVSLAVQGCNAAPELDALAAFALRVTGPEMRERIAAVIERGCPGGGCKGCQEQIDAIMALLTTEPT